MNKSRSIVLLIALILVGTACQTRPEPISVTSPTTTMVRPITVAPIAKSTMISTLTLTFNPVPVWQILFAGAPCTELVAKCMTSMGSPTYYYSINSDGSDLRQVESLTGSITSPLPQHTSPVGAPQPSPDRSSWVYYTNGAPDVPRGLYLLDTTSEKESLLLSSKAISGSMGFFYPVCWSSDGTAIRFYVRFQEDQQRRDTFYSVDRNGQNLKELFTLTDLMDTHTEWAINAGTCSPDNRELAFSLDQDGKLYLLDLNSGQWRQILTNYGVYRLATKDLIANSK